ncbi:hypothetical protein BD289DRAFT_422725 [Coniella lustricola]|uniref:R3H-associated N-terminal domain-containing protein n=1 Tax=Coniella lustricola TaxID=2025994 RepID=A0A2T3AKG5_9PEZI|nr:hypothetical protein BD289DRAFT_422725 [Coniella lustricola]
MAYGRYSAVPPPSNVASSPPAQPPPPQQEPQEQQQPQQPAQAPHPAQVAAGAIDIEAWTISALQSLSVSPEARGIGGTPLAIPLDDHHHAAAAAVVPVLVGEGGVPRVVIAVNEAHANAGITPPRRPSSRRDSMKRREALLKGKEGSRQRRRWDMARLTDVPNVEPPKPSDWEPRPVYPIHHIPYHIAQFWDRGLRQQVEDKGATSRKKKATTAKGQVPRVLRDTLKKTPGVKGWVRTLEEPVRHFLTEQTASDDTSELDKSSESDFSDDEVVFVGRKSAPLDAAAAAASAVAWKKAHREVRDQTVDHGMIFDSLEEDESGAFKRWLTHSISDYYGLDSRSVTMGNPARRCVYIGIRETDVRRGSQLSSELPRPLWERL